MLSKMQCGVWWSWKFHICRWIRSATGILCNWLCERVSRFEMRAQDDPWIHNNCRCHQGSAPSRRLPLLFPLCISISTVQQSHLPTFLVTQFTMDNLAKWKGKTYAERPATPLGDETGLTSTPVSEHPTRGNTPRPAAPNPYHYQPAITSTRPELTALRRNSSNYAQAQADSLTKLTTASPEQSPPAEDPASSPPRAPGRSYSFSTEDHKRSAYHHLMGDKKEGEGEEGDGEGAKKGPLKSPGIGNSEVKGREFGFTSTG